MTLTNAEIASMVDFAILKPEFSTANIIEKLYEARELGAFSVCVNSRDVELAVETLTDESDPLVCAVIGFPHGATEPIIKELEAERAILQGAHEIDYVMNIRAAKDRDFETLQREAELITEAAKGRWEEGETTDDVLVKVIFETSFFTVDEISEISNFYAQAGVVDFIKTSTGFSTAGATDEMIDVMVKAAEGVVEVKASGGISSREIVEKYHAAGVTRFGLSGLSAILENEVVTGAY